MTAPNLASQLKASLAALAHPSWCERDVHGCHVSAEKVADGEGVMLVAYRDQPAKVHAGLLDPMSPASARKLARLLAGLGHAELAALVTSTAAMADGAS